MDEKIKVTDKRMFTPEGELREAFREVEADADQPEDRPGVEQIEESQNSEPTLSEPTFTEPAATDPTAPVDTRPPVDPVRGGGATAGGELPSPTFMDLVGLLAQPIAMFLGDAALPGGEAEENLPLARFHIDLLELVQAKTQGNISTGEAKLLEDLLYQLRLRYVERAG